MTGALILGAGLALWMIGNKQDPVQVKRGDKTDTGGLWNTELPHFYQEEEPREPIPVVGGKPLDTGVGLEEHLMRSRQAFFKQQADDGMRIMEQELPALIGEGQDESGWILMPRFANERQPRSGTVSKRL